MASEDFSFESSYFVSAPPSPYRLSNTDTHHDFKFDVGSGSDGFITDSSFEDPKKKRRLHRCAESMPAGSFADELFCDGKVTALPLPPGCRSPAAGASSLISPRSPLTRRNSLWNDDFDPFVAALESVKEDNHRRVRWAPGHNHQQQEKQLSVTVPKSPVQEKLAEPKGVDFSRRLRQVKTLITNNGDSERKTKSQKMMRFLTMKSRRVEKKEETENHGSNKSMNGLLRKLSFNRSRSMSSSETKKKTVAMAPSPASATRNGSRVVTKASVMQYRPRLLLCLGYGLRRSSYVK